MAEIHAIDGCDQMGLSPDGDLIETLCRACLATVRWAVASYVADKREGRCGAALTRCAPPAGVPLDTCAACSRCARANERPGL